MAVILFVTAADEADADAVVAALGEVPASRKLLHRPATAHDPYVDDGVPPALVLEISFADIADLEAPSAAGGALQTLARLLPGARQQVMLSRSYPVPDSVFRTPPGELPGTYLVAYTGVAPDRNAWLSHYVAHHPNIMARFPGIRAIEICTQADWISALPWRREDAMQRNKVVFDSPDALTAALASPVRHEMRADYHQFPPFEGSNTHFAMRTLEVTPG